MIGPLNAIRVEHPRPDFIREHPQAGWFAVATVCFGAFMGQLDASIVTLAFPSMQREFGRPLAAVQWVSLAYLLTLVGLLPAAGRLADAAGRKQLYLYGFALFTVASAACGFAPDLPVLIGLRVLQAAGATMLQANSVALVVTSVPREKMRAALGIQAAAQAIGLAAGPMLGGLLVASVGWRWVFWINLPVGVLGLLAGRFLLPRTREWSPLQRFDLVGLTLLIAASATILLGLSGLGGLGMPWWLATLLIIVGLLLASAFLRWERTVADPLVRLEILRERAVSIGLIGALCGYLILFGPLTLIPQTAATHSGVGLTLTCLPLGFGIASVGAQRLLPRNIGPRIRAAAGAAVAAVALAALAWSLHEPVALAVLLLVTGIGLGVFIPTNNTTIMAAIPARLSATGGGLVNMARSLGTALGVAVVTVCLHAGGASGAGTALICLAALGAVGAISGTLTGSRSSI